MPRLLPAALAGLLAAVALAAPARAHAEPVHAAAADPQERPADGGRDLRLVSSSYDAAAGRWTVSARFWDKPAAGTSALLRAHLAERGADGTCESRFPNVLLAAFTDPADRGGRGSVDGQPADAVKALDGDGLGFTLSLTDPRLAGRSVCGVQDVTLSRNEPFDSVADLTFPPPPGGFPSPPPPPPAADVTAPAAVMGLIRSPRDLRRGRVRVSVRGTSEPAQARVSLYGPGGLLARATSALAPGQEIRPVLALGRRARTRLKRTGRLAVRVVARVEDAAGNATVLRQAVTLRTRRA